MKRFAFKLEKVRRLRSWTEEEARLELGRVTSERNAIENELRLSAERRVKAMNLNFESAQTISTRRVAEAYFSRLDAEKERLINEAAKVDIQVEAAREVWRTAKTELQSLDNLKERRLTEFRKTRLAAEESELNDIRPQNRDSSRQR
ncbi:MAG: hypothetical protein Pg6A_02660 [Termitinemataceae bacterium]|jgi:flagellar export protein FliJ|nr:MAG: hypothetical protein Pg6A_02660 [Termitinemataceae bacterium]